MKKFLMTNMSSKGQVVIPQEFRKSMGLTPGTPLAVFTDGSALLFKPLEMPKAEVFDKLLRESRKAAKSAGLKRSEVKKAIKKVRNENRS